jgi:hypothetical protein
VAHLSVVKIVIDDEARDFSMQVLIPSWRDGCAVDMGLCGWQMVHDKSCKVQHWEDGCDVCDPKWAKPREDQPSGWSIVSPSLSGMSTPRLDYWFPTHPSFTCSCGMQERTVPSMENLKISSISWLYVDKVPGEFSRNILPGLR